MYIFYLNDAVSCINKHIYGEKSHTDCKCNAFWFGVKKKKVAGGILTTGGVGLENVEEYAYAEDFYCILLSSSLT